MMRVTIARFKLLAANCALSFKKPEAKAENTTFTIK